MIAAARTARLETNLFLLAAALCFQGCGVYFNTYFNAEKAHRQALELRERRLNENPQDTVPVAPAERQKLERAIAKGSKVLELWPKHPEYAPKAVFLIGESYLLMEEHDRAIQKFEEYLRYYPNSPRVPLARIHLAKALYLDGQSLRARDLLDEILRSDPQGEVRREAFLLSARMQVDDNSLEDGLALYERLLAEGAFAVPESRAEAHWQAARMAFQLREWERARRHALAGDLATLPAAARYRNQRLALLSLFELGRHEEAASEIRALLRRKEFRSARPDLNILLARAHEARGDWPGAEALYREVARTSTRSAAAAEAHYRRAARLLREEGREELARAWFDSAAMAGQEHEFGQLGARKAEALSRLEELRAQMQQFAAEQEAASGDRSGPEEAGPREGEAAPEDSGEQAEEQGDREDRAGGEPEDRSRQEENGDGDEDASRDGERHGGAQDPESPHSAAFLIAEVYRFQLEMPDSARAYLERIVTSPIHDPEYTRRAYYALAWLENESFGNKERSDSLYRELLARYPGTRWAKQAERNLGLAPTVQTDEDKARELFLLAESRRFGNEPAARVIAAYREVADRYPATPDAAKALFVAAYLEETRARAPGAPTQAMDTAAAAYRAVQRRYPGTPYAEVASARLEGFSTTRLPAVATPGPVPPQESGEPGESGDVAASGETGETRDPGEAREAGVTGEILETVEQVLPPDPPAAVAEELEEPKPPATFDDTLDFSEEDLY